MNRDDIKDFFIAFIGFTILMMIIGVAGVLYYQFIDWFAHLIGMIK